VHRIIGRADARHDITRSSVLSEQPGQVRAGLVDGPAGVPADDRVHQAVVVVAVLEHLREVEPDVVGDRVDQVLVERQQHGVAGGAGDGAVQGEVGGDHPVQRPGGVGVGALVAQGGDHLDVGGGAAAGGEAGGLDLQAAAHLDHVALPGVGDLPAHAHRELGGGQHVGARSLPPLHQPGVHQRLHRLAHGVAAHAEQLHQRGFGGDARADRPVAGRDPVPELGHRRVDESGASRHAG
jgi:hypothetical protein